jgi:fructokinase
MNLENVSTRDHRIPRASFPCRIIPNMVRKNLKVMCVGEVLWDSLPGGLFLGGAPFNVAYHLHALSVDALLATCVGDDVLGRIVCQRTREKGLSTDLFQIETTLPTGLVHVLLDAAGNASYEIVAPAAWDCIRMTPAIEEVSAAAGAIVFGSLAQRGAVSRVTIQQLLERDCLKVFDVNLRPPHGDRAIIEYGLERAEVVKLNDQEFARLAGWFSLPEALEKGAAALAARFSVETICVTRGSRGAVLWNRGNFTAHPGFTVQVRDTVGSGDAFLASLVDGLMNNLPDERILSSANALGAFVATREGPTPPVDRDAVRRIESMQTNGVIEGTNG